MAYLDRPDMLQKVLNELFHLFRFESCEYVGQALHVVLEAMNRHLSERHIQISGRYFFNFVLFFFLPKF